MREADTFMSRGRFPVLDSSYLWQKLVLSHILGRLASLKGGRDQS